MIEMRQRLFLLAGWFVAAIGAGLVASAAVAIAGGQVLDRPLQPLTTAEVAALPVTAVGSSETLVPQASGGTETTVGGPAVGSDDSQSTSEETIPTPRWDRFTNPARFQSGVVIIEAGKVSFAVAEDRIHVLWVTPGSGYLMNRLSSNETSVTISFSSSRDAWLVKASLIDGLLVLSSVKDPMA